MQIPVLEQRSLLSSTFHKLLHSVLAQISTLQHSSLLSNMVLHLQLSVLNLQRIYSISLTQCSDLAQGSILPGSVIIFKGRQQTFLQPSSFRIIQARLCYSLAFSTHMLHKWSCYTHNKTPLLFSMH